MKILAESHAADPIGYNQTLLAFDQLTTEPKDILEIGFGMGDFSIRLGNKFPNANILGIDTHKLSVQTANKNLQNLSSVPPNVKFELRSQPRLEEPAKSFDVITTVICVTIFTIWY